MVGSTRACLRVIVCVRVYERRWCQDNWWVCQPLCVCVCGYNVSDSSRHESVGWGLGILITQSLPLSLHLFSTSSSFISAIAPLSPVLYASFSYPSFTILLSLFVSLFHSSIVPRGPKEVWEMWKCVCVLRSISITLFFVFFLSFFLLAILFFKRHYVLFLISNSFIPCFFSLHSLYAGKSFKISQPGWKDSVRGHPELWAWWSAVEEDRDTF